MVMMEGEWNGVRVFRAMQHSQQDEYIHASVHLQTTPWLFRQRTGYREAKLSIDVAGTFTVCEVSCCEKIVAWTGEGDGRIQGGEQWLSILDVKMD